MQKSLILLRRLLLCAGIFSGLLVFWLPAHEVFEGPKTFGFLIYSSVLLALALPLYPKAFRRSGLAPYLGVAGLLLGCTSLSLLSAWHLLPSNILVCLEKLAPLMAGAQSALIYAMEESKTQRRILFCLCASHALLAFYGLVQLLDQALGQALHINVDLIRWSSFGEARVYSTLGNPDYMAAHLSIFLPLWLALPWRDSSLRLRAALSVAALSLLLIPLAVLFIAYGFAANLWAAVLQVYPAWALLSLLLYFLSRRLPLRQVWLGFAYLLLLLIVAAQGRAAYLGLAVSLGLSAFLAWKMAGPELLKRQRSFLRFNAQALGLALAILLFGYFLRAASPQSSLLNFAPLRSGMAISDSVIGRLGDFFKKGSDATNVRRFYYKAAWRLGLEHPLLGVGFGNHPLFTAGAQSEVWKDWAKDGNDAINYVEPHVELYTHNDFLQNFAETGLLGLGSFLFFWVFFIWKAYQLTRRGWAEEAGRLGLGLLGLAAAFLSSAMLNFPWRVLATQQLCWLGFAMLASMDRALSKEGTSPQGIEAKPPWALALAGLLAFLLALWPARWFYASSLFKMGNLGRDQNQYQSGADFYLKAAQAGLSGTQRVELYLYLGSMENMLGRPDLAESWFKKGVEIYPNFIEALYNLGYTSMLRFNSSHLESDRQAAIDYFKRVLDIDPRYANALNNLGNLYYSKQDYIDAQACYEPLVHYAPQMIEAHYNLGVTYLLEQRRSDGEAQMAEVLKIQPNYPQALNLVNQLKKLPAGARLYLK